MQIKNGAGAGGVNIKKQGAAGLLADVVLQGFEP